MSLEIGVDRGIRAPEHGGTYTNRRCGRRGEDLARQCTWQERIRHPQDVWTAATVVRRDLAARLQSLTRDLDAALVIDRATWERAQPAAAGFEKRPDVPIRGRRETQDVYALLMPAHSE